MTPEEILRDALDKITAQRQAHEERLAVLQSETSDVERWLAEATRWTMSVSALLAGDTVAPPAPVEAEHAPEAESRAQEPAPEPDAVTSALLKAGAEVAERAVEAAASAPAPEDGEPLDVPALAARALKIAQSLSKPDRTERKVKMLAAAALKCACGLTNREVAEAFGLKGPDVCPAALVEARILSDEIDHAARTLRDGKVDEPGAKPAPVEAKAVATQQPAPTAKVPEPAPSATVRELADDLLTDLPTMLAVAPKGVSAATIAEWFGCTEEQAREAASVLIRAGKAVAEDKRLRLPAGEAVPA